MQIEFTGHHVDVTDALRDFTTKKFERFLEHYEKINIISIHITFAVEKLNQSVKACLQVKGAQIVASAESENMYAAIDLMVDKLTHNMQKYKDKLTGHR